LIFNTALYAQKFEASVNKTTVGQNERFQVDFTMNNADANQVNGFRGPVFKDFRVLNGPQTQTSIQIINGKVSGSKTFTYNLMPRELGEFTIGTAQINYQGKQYQSKPIKIKVVKAAQQSNKSSSGGVSNEDLAKNVFIRANVDKTKIYKGEQVTLTYKLYNRLNISSPQISKLPTYNGFWAEELETSNTINFQIEMYKGERYRAAVIKKVALFPTKSGPLTITPFELRIPVQIKKKRSSNNSVFDDFFNDSFFGVSETVNYDAKSNAIKLEVLPLPEQGKPESFSGAVGDFSINGSMDKSDIKTNESVTISILARGKGNIKLLDIPEIKLPAGFENYDPRTSESIIRKGIIAGDKKIEYLFVPRVPGTKTIPAVEFSYFNPRVKKYFTKTVGPFTLNVDRGEISYETPAAGFTKEDVRLLSQDIRFIKTSNYDFERRSDLTTLQSWFWYVIISPLIFMFIIVGVKRRQDKLSGNVQLLRSTKAEKSARAKLKNAKKALDQKNSVLFYDEISRALSGYLEDKLSIQKSNFSLERAIVDLQNRDVDSQIISQVKRISEQCEFARFSPQGDNQADQNFYQDTVNLIVKLESVIKKKK